MNKEKNVSIVIPTFNRAEYLVNCIDSCLAQTVLCEIIVCDHGSTDATPEVVKKYGDKIIYIRREKDFGVHFCWLDGILHASNEYVHLQFDDDWIEPLFIEKCIHLFDDTVGAVITNNYMFEEDSKVLSSSNTFLDKKYDTGLYDSSWVLKLREYALISPACVLYRKEILLDYLFVGKVPFATSHYRGVGPDLLFFIMSCTLYPKVGYVNEYLSVFRVHGHSITVDAYTDDSKKRKLLLAYESARHLYLMDVFVRYTNILWLLRKILGLKIRLRRIIKLK